jgi:hypothetical protein
MEAKPCFIGHGLMENSLRRDCRCSADARVGPCPRAVMLGADKGYDAANFVVGDLRNHLRAPACRAQHQWPALGDRPAHDA